MTEMLSGIDLVGEQIRIAAGEPLGYTQADVVLRGHAIEFRINAEDVRTISGPRPAASRRSCRPADPGVRMDTHLFPGYEVPPYYDSLLGKLVVWGPDRATAIARSRVALDELVVDGLATNVPFHQAVLANETFLEGRFTTNLLDRVGSAAFRRRRRRCPLTRKDPMTDTTTAPGAQLCRDPEAHPAPLADPAGRSDRRVRPGRVASWASRA